jgi:diguanylate cyclase (GGDEF)-like protein/PAS domain S-box-containing protein
VLGLQREATVSADVHHERMLRDLILRLSARLAAVLEDDVDASVIDALALVGERTGADRAYVMRFDHEASTFDNTHEWVSGGISSERLRVQAAPMRWMEPWLERFRAGEAVAIHDVRVLREGSDELLRELQAQSIVSVLWVPLPGPRALLGFVGFDAVRSKRTWSGAEVDLLRAAANVIAGALARVDAVVERDLASERLRTVAALVPGVVYQYQVEGDGRSSFPYVSPGIADLTALSPDGLRRDGSLVVERIHPDDRKAVFAARERSREELSPWSTEFRVRDRHDRWRWLRGQALPQRLASGATLWHGVIVDVSEELALADALRARQSELARITETLRDIVVLTESDLRIRYVSPSVRDVLGFEAEDVVGRRVTDFLHEDELEIARRHLASGFRERDGATLVHRMRHADGSVRYFESLVHVLAAGEGALFSARDVTERVAYQQRLEREVAFRAALVALTNDMLDHALDERFYQQVLERAIALVPDAQGGSLLLQAADGSYRFVAAVGFDLAELQALQLQPGEMGDRPATVARVAVRDLATRLSPERRAVLEGAGRIDQIETTLSVPIIASSVLRGYMNLDNFASADAFDQDSHEIAEALSAQVGVALQRLQLERELQQERNRYQRMASHDALTGLPNRRLFQDRLDQALLRAQRRGHAIALMYLDLDGFKDVNDSYGHDVGDELLAAVSARLVGLVRAEDTVARLGGDEFALVLTDVTSKVSADLVASKLLAALEAPFSVCDDAVVIGASVGIALFPLDAEHTDGLMKAADMAMYRVKQGGKGAYAFFADIEAPA